MKFSAAQKARVRLIAARKAAEQLDYQLPFEEFHALWYSFITAAKNIYTQLDKGVDGNPQSMQWFGGKDKERRKDPLLQYIFQARDDDEHSNGLVLDSFERTHSFGPNGGGSFVEDVVDSKTGRRVTRVTIKSSDGKPVRVMGRVRHMRLRPVIGRGPITYAPPTEHLGRPLESNWPHYVAHVALEYLERLVSEAEDMARKTRTNT